MVQRRARWTTCLSITGGSQGAEGAVRPVAALPLPGRRRGGGRWLVGILGLLTLGMVALASIQVGNLPIRINNPALGITSPPSAAYTFVGGEVAKINATTGAILARRPYHLATQGPSLAISRDGTSVFVLDSAFDGSKAIDLLTVLEGDTLAPQISIPADNYAQYMGVHGRTVCRQR